MYRYDDEKCSVGYLEILPIQMPLFIGAGVTINTEKIHEYLRDGIWPFKVREWPSKEMDVDVYVLDTKGKKASDLLWHALHEIYLLVERIADTRIATPFLSNRSAYYTAFELYSCYPGTYDKIDIMFPITDSDYAWHLYWQRTMKAVSEAIRLAVIPFPVIFATEAELDEYCQKVKSDTRRTRRRKKEAS